MKLVKEQLKENINESSNTTFVSGTPLIVGWTKERRVGIKNIDTNKTIVFDTENVPELIRVLTNLMKNNYLRWKNW